MRKIEQQIIDAIRARKCGEFIFDNTVVRIASYGDVTVTLHGNRIVTHTESTRLIRLDSCGWRSGWRTRITASRINTVLNAFYVPKTVGSVKGEWMIAGQKFEDGMTLTY